MQNILRHFPEGKQRQKAWIYGTILTAYIFMIALGNVFMLVLGENLEDIDILENIQAIDPIVVLLEQAFFSVIMFIGPVALLSFFIFKVNLAEFFPRISWTTVGITIIIMVSVMVFQSAIIEWNMNLHLGDSGFVEWSRRIEHQLKILTEYITDFSSSFHFVIALVVIGLLPAIGEELFFRGFIQNLFAKAFHNQHVAIWVTGFVFAVIHMQLYGIVPRLFLSVIFGYMYHWSGKLTVAMLAHFINNSTLLIALYFVQSGHIEISPEQMEKAAPWPIVLICGVLSIYLLNMFYKKSLKDG